MRAIASATRSIVCCHACVRDDLKPNRTTRAILTSRRIGIVASVPRRRVGISSAGLLSRPRALVEPDELLHNFLHNSGRQWLTRRIISNCSTRYDAVTTPTPMGDFEISGGICAHRGLKNRRSRPRRLAQVPALRILTVCGDVAEWPKAAVC
jgi:hypothetical protein